METTTGKIIALDGRMATITVKTSSVCHRCAAGKGCGAGIFQAGDKPRQIQVELPFDMSPQVGDSVELMIGSKHLLRAAMLAYGLPMLTMLGSLLALQSFGDVIGDATGVAVAILGLVAGLMIGRSMLGRESVCEQFVPSIGRNGDGGTRRTTD